VPLSPEQRSQRARIAALARWSQEDPRPTGIRAQAGLRARFEREAKEKFPDLPAAEQTRRADAMYRGHMASLAFRSSKARAARKATRGGEGRGAA
jgi:hypothetical protein